MSNINEELLVEEKVTKKTTSAKKAVKKFALTRLK